jgi:hypothetical protein
MSPVQVPTNQPVNAIVGGSDDLNGKESLMIAVENDFINIYLLEQTVTGQEKYLPYLLNSRLVSNF